MKQKSFCKFLKLLHQRIMVSLFEIQYHHFNSIKSAEQMPGALVRRNNTKQHKAANGIR
jgi:hypothetical protein